MPRGCSGRAEFAFWFMELHSGCEGLWNIYAINRHNVYNDSPHSLADNCCSFGNI